MQAVQKYCLLPFFTFCLFALQDVSGDDQTHLEAAQTHWADLGCCYAHFGPVMDIWHVMDTTGPKCAQQ